MSHIERSQLSPCLDTLTNNEWYSLLFLYSIASREHSSNLLITSVQWEFYLLVFIYIRALAIKHIQSFLCKINAALGFNTFTQPSKIVRIWFFQIKIGQNLLKEKSKWLTEHYKPCMRRKTKYNFSLLKKRRRTSIHKINSKIVCININFLPGKLKFTQRTWNIL